MVLEGFLEGLLLLLLIVLRLLQLLLLLVLIQIFSESCNIVDLDILNWSCYFGQYCPSPVICNIFKSVVKVILQSKDVFVVNPVDNNNGNKADNYRVCLFDLSIVPKVVRNFC